VPRKYENMNCGHFVCVPGASLGDKLNGYHVADVGKSRCADPDDFHKKNRTLYANRILTFDLTQYFN